MPIKYRVKDEALQAVRLDPNLEYISLELRDDEDVVKEAIINGAAIYPVSFRLQNEPEILHLFALHSLYPDNDYARVLYSVKLDPELFYYEPDLYKFRDRNYCNNYKYSRQFNIAAKLIRSDFNSIYDEYNRMSVEELRLEAKRLKKEEIAQIRENYSTVLPANTFTFEGASDFPLIAKLISCRAANKPFASIKDIVISQIQLHEMEKEAFLSTTRGGSFPEKFMASLLRYLNISFIREMVFKWSDGTTQGRGRKRYDFYIPSLEAIIEVHGAQHFQTGFEFCGGRTLEEEQKNDRYKKALAKKNGICHYITIDASYSLPSYLARSISENNEFIKLFNLEKVDWNSVRQGVVSIKSEYPTPVHDIRIKYLRDWLEAIDESLTKDDYILPPNFKDFTHQRPNTDELDAQIKRAIPSSTGLYPHEILLLRDAAKMYSIEQTDFPGKWFYQYGIADVPYYLGKLMDQDYMTVGDIRKTLSMQTVSNLKAYMIKKKLTPIGKKEQLIENIISNIPVSTLEEDFPTRYYALTDKGEEELRNNQYLFALLHENQTIWTLNREHGKSFATSSKITATKTVNYLHSTAYNRNLWLIAAEQAKKEKNFIEEIKLYIEILCHDLEQKDNRKNDVAQKYIGKNLHYYFPYTHSLLKPAPGIIKEIQIAMRKCDLSDETILQMVKKIVNDLQIYSLFFKKKEIISIIGSTLINDISTVSNTFDNAYSRIIKDGWSPVIK